MLLLSVIYGAFLIREVKRFSFRKSSDIFQEICNFIPFTRKTIELLVARKNEFEYIVRKGPIVCNQHFLPFPQRIV